MDRCCLFVISGFLLIVALHTTGASLLNTNQDLVVQFGTYDAKFQQCFYQKLYSGMISPQSVTFNNVSGVI